MNQIGYQKHHRFGGVKRCDSNGFFDGLAAMIDFDGDHQSPEGQKHQKTEDAEHRFDERREGGGEKDHSGDNGQEIRQIMDDIGNPLTVVEF